MTTQKKHQRSLLSSTKEYSRNVTKLKERLRITISPAFATNETIKLLSVYEGRPMADITMELVEEAIQARLQQQRIPQAVLTYLTGWLQEKFLDNLSEMIREGEHELAPDINSK